MSGLDPKDAEAVDRLVLHLLQDTYSDLAAAMRNHAPQAAEAMFHSLEQRIASALVRISLSKAEGAASEAIAIEVGATMCAAMERAHRREQRARAA